MNLETFLEKKTLFYDKIDYDCIEKSWKIISKYITLPYVIHIVGTNGKGSTGRFIASFLDQLGFDILHYSSPHILFFNERIWINGANSTNNQLDEAHIALQSLLPKELLNQLTYFEYTTLLAFYLSSNRDYLVAEAGLGGEFDATNVIENDLTVLTTIGLDHQNFLGDTIKDITGTKARSCNNSMIISEQRYNEVYSYILELFKNNKDIYNFIDFQDSVDIDIYKDKLPLYLQNNLKTAIYVLKYLKLDFKRFTLPKLFGRFEYIKPNIIVDVGHNPLAASAIAQQLAKTNLKYILIYNSYKDKDYKKNIEILKPYIKKVFITDIQDDRIIDKHILENILKLEKIDVEYFNINNLDDKENYLVFGSFLVVEEFLKLYKGLEIGK